MGELSVVALDLDLGRSVHLLDQPRAVWRRKGWGGDGSLVCWHCFHGVDAPAGTRVPLIYRGGKKYGKVRAHFAHPSGQAPASGHHPETIWHANAKQQIVRWATHQPNVLEAHTEYATADGKRRSDVEIRLSDGTQIVVEVQQQPLTDDAWTRRHDDYVASGLCDVWLWHPNLGVPGIARDEPQCSWLLAQDLNRIGAPLALPHKPNEQWWDQPSHRLYGLHFPPCPGDKVITSWMDVELYAVDRSGLVLPSSVHQELREQAASVARRARVIRQRIAAGELTVASPAVASHPTTKPLATAATARHEVHRIDALPGQADPALRRYRCQICNWVTGDALNDGLHKLVKYP